MAITSEQQLARLLAEMDSLTNDDRIEIMRGAYFVKGTLRGLCANAKMPTGRSHWILYERWSVSIWCRRTAGRRPGVPGPLSDRSR